MTNSAPEDLSYEPDYAVVPGASLAELLEDTGMTQAELARRTGISAKHINMIIKGSANLSPQTALKLEHVLPVPARVWNALEANYQGHLSRLDEARQLEQHIGWASSQLIKRLAEKQLISATKDRIQQLREVLRFFGVSNIAAWDDVWSASAGAAYRKAKLEGDPVALAAWMRLGELAAAEVETPPFDRAAFEQILPAARRLTMVRDLSVWLPQLEELCRAAGVVLIVKAELPKARVNGIARWLSPTKALIQLSVRHKRDDIFWFSFFHECGHLLLHSKRSGPRDVPPTFVDTGKGSGTIETEADSFASNLLIPHALEPRLAGVNSLAAARQFAAEIGVSPGIVVGRLHHLDLKQPPWGIKDLIVHYTFTDA